jgi:hypothetical protein
VEVCARSGRVLVRLPKATTFLSPHPPPPFLGRWMLSKEAGASPPDISSEQVPSCDDPSWVRALVDPFAGEPESPASPLFEKLGHRRRGAFVGVFAA